MKTEREQPPPMRASPLGLIRERGLGQPRAVALLAPGRPSLTYHGLLEHVEATAARLTSLGVERGDRVALVLPNGPEMVTAFLAISSRATCALLNPAYSAHEFAAYLSDLKVKALMVQAGSRSAAGAAAGSLGLRVIEVSPQPGAPAGVFSLPGAGSGNARLGPAVPDEVAVLTRTSGTTSHPKIIPLTHANLAASAQSTALSLGLTPQDRSLNILPLFHLHGLIGGVISSLTAGASVICTPGLGLDQVLEWMDELAPTWYTAAPTMHQAVLETARQKPEAASRVRLRFIRSASAPLPQHLARELEAMFGVPVIEAYGMTEAAPMISGNPLPPGHRKPGSVGVPFGCEVAVLDEQGRPLPAGEVGEIAVRGPNVMRAYENNPQANAHAFVDGWLRSGDLGYRDEDGYLFIRGRIKEVINRGGEKITPQEIDEVLLQHPSVLEAVTFAVPHLTLGEEVAAAIVVRPGRQATAVEVRRFAAGRLAEFKVPRQIVFVAGIPKSPTGKVQRAAIYKMLRAELERQEAGGDKVPPDGPVEVRLAELWRQLLGVERIGRTDDFFDLGGNSLLAASLFTQLEAEFGVSLPLSALIEHATLAGLAGLIQAAPSAAGTLLVPMQPKGSEPPIFLAPGGLGAVLYLRDLVRHLGEDHPIYGLQSVRPDLRSHGMVRAAELARRYVQALQEAYPDGPYLLFGHSSGGIIVYEMACQLRQAGGRVGMLGMFDTYLPGKRPRASAGERVMIHWRNVAAAGGLRRRAAYLLSRLNRLLINSIRSPALLDRAARAGLIPGDRMTVSELLLDTYQPAYYDGTLTIFRASRRSPYERIDPLQAWKEYARRVELIDVPGDHWSLLLEPHVAELASCIRRCLEADAGGG